jgi:uncharacterized protein (DUF362 family)
MRFFRWLPACALGLAVVTGRAENPQPRPEPDVVQAPSTPDPQPSPAESPYESQVFYALLPAAVENGVVRDGMVRRMVDSVVMAASGKSDIASAWRSFVRPTERIGLKVSTAAAPVSSTHPAVVAAVAEGLVAAGVPPTNIIIWDREARDLRRAGFGKLAERFRVIGTDEAGGYAEKEVITAAIMGKLIIGDRNFLPGPREQTSSQSHLSVVLAGEVDKVIHLPALTDSTFSGVNGALSGMVLDNLDNWRRLARSPHHGDPFLPEIYADPRIGGKVVLTILDALRPQYAGGPFPGAQDKTNYGAIFASPDAVAIDATALRLLDEFRHEAGMPLWEKKVRWPSTAEMLGIGTAAEERIELIRTGLESEVRWSEP